MFLLSSQAVDSTTYHHPEERESDFQEGGIPLSPSSSAIPEPTSPYLPRCARYLLWHYATCTIPSLSAIPLAAADAPWTELHLPCALKAYAELNVLSDSSLSRVSLLYSLLSMSCFQLSSLHRNGGKEARPSSAALSSPFTLDESSMSSRWETQARKFRNIAQTGFQRCLQSLSTEKGAKLKYKEIFLAAMSIICTGVRCNIVQANEMV